MTDRLWADVSEFQVPVNDSYPYHFLSFRSNDGTYRDHDFAANLAWAKHATDTGKLVGFMVYFVYETNWQQTFETFKSMVGVPHPQMAVMIDVESWGGKIRGDQSASLNALRNAIIAWLNSYKTIWQRTKSWLMGTTSKAKVLGYANAGDFGALWPSRGDIKVVLANYSSNPAFLNKVGHQFSSSFNVPPFGPCDINSADGLAPDQFAKAIGLKSAAVPAPAPAPKPIPAPAPVPTPVLKKEIEMILVTVDKATVPAGKVWPGAFLSDGITLHHVTATQGTTSNVANYAKAGVTSALISYNEYLAYVAENAVRYGAGPVPQ